MSDKLDAIERYTISRNGVPVTRVTLPADELRALIAEVRRLKSDNAYFRSVALKGPNVLLSMAELQRRAFPRAPTGLDQMAGLSLPEGAEQSPDVAKF